LSASDEARLEGLNSIPFARLARSPTEREDLRVQKTRFARLDPSVVLKSGKLLLASGGNAVLTP